MNKKTLFCLQDALQLRSYQSSDLPNLGKLFYETIHKVNQKDYTPEQLQAWAPTITPAAWHERFLHTFTQIAVLKNKIVGFGNLEQMGYLDCLYVHHAYQSCGIGTAICDKLEQYAMQQGAQQITVHASITAKPFFEHRGYVLLQEQLVKRNDVFLKNYKMQKKGIPIFFKN